MRFPSPVVVFLLILGLVGTVDARGGKGGGGGGGGGHVSRGGGGQKFSGGGAAKHQAAQSHKPAKDKIASGKPAKEKIAKDKIAKDKPAKSAKEEKARDPSDGDDRTGDDSGEVGETPNKKEKQLANFQRQRDKKISQAEHLRQIAERNGNANLAANADRMEAQAHEQYAQKVSHLEKFGVTDPELDLDGDGLADPYVPDVEPLADPVGTLEGLLPLGR